MEATNFISPSTISLAETALLNPSLADVFSTPTPAAKAEKKQVKKRKSWGQELPIPKTNLPPRKRAKTEDEKEQRRIERVLRNRQAAQSSRERKRLEVEHLETERDAILEHNNILKKRLLTVEDEKEALRKQVAKLQMLLGQQPGGNAPTPSATPSPMMNAKVFDNKLLKTEELDIPSLFDSQLPTTMEISNATAASQQQQQQQHQDSQSTGQFASDLTQHPAEMLCDGDLQCQPKSNRPTPCSPLPLDATRSSLPPAQLATLRLFLTTHSIACSTIASPLLRLLASLKKGSRLKTATITPTLFAMILWLISTPTPPIRSASTRPTTSASARTKTTSAPTSSSPPSTRRPSTFRTSLLRRLLTCSPALARPLRDATARALHEQAKYALLREGSDGRGSIEQATRGGATGGSSAASMSGSRTELWRLMTMVLVIDQWEKQRAQAGKR